MIKRQIPALIENWIEAMNDDRTPAYQRQNYRGSLSDLKDEIEKAIKLYDREQRQAERKYG